MDCSNGRENSKTKQERMIARSLLSSKSSLGRTENRIGVVLLWWRWPTVGCLITWRAAAMSYEPQARFRIQLSGPLPGASQLNALHRQAGVWQ